MKTLKCVRHFDNKKYTSEQNGQSNARGCSGASAQYVRFLGGQRVEWNLISLSQGTGMGDLANLMYRVFPAKNTKDVQLKQTHSSKTHFHSIKLSKNYPNPLASFMNAPLSQRPILQRVTVRLNRLLLRSTCVQKCVFRVLQITNCVLVFVSVASDMLAISVNIQFVGGGSVFYSKIFKRFYCNGYLERSNRYESFGFLKNYFTM